jgi:hypothetical protein
MMTALREVAVAVLVVLALVAIVPAVYFTIAPRWSGCETPASPPCTPSATPEQLAQRKAALEDVALTMLTPWQPVSARDAREIDRVVALVRLALVADQTDSVTVRRGTSGWEVALGDAVEISITPDTSPDFGHPWSGTLRPLRDLAPE